MMVRGGATAKTETALRAESLCVSFAQIVRHILTLQHAVRGASFISPFEVIVACLSVILYRQQTFLVAR